MQYSIFKISAYKYKIKHQVSTSKFTMGYFTNLPATFKAYLDSLPEGLKMTLYIKEVPKGYSVMLLYSPDASDVKSNQLCSIKTEPNTAENMFITDSKPVTPAKSVPDSTSTLPSSTKGKLRSIKTVPNLHVKSQTLPTKRPANTPVKSVAKSKRTTVQQRSVSTYNLPKPVTKSPIPKQYFNMNNTYKQLAQSENWTCRAFKTPLGWYRFLQNQLTGHRTAVHTATTNTSTDKTVYLSQDRAMPSIISYVTRYPEVKDPMTSQQKQCFVSAITERIYHDMSLSEL